MYAQFFGNYLLTRDIVTKEQLITALQKKDSQHMKLGTLAIHAGYMTANEVDRIVILQTHLDKRFGEIAIHEGYLTESQVAELLKKQKPDFLRLGQVLLEDGILDNNQLQEAIINYQSESEFDDFIYSDETREIISHLLENFFVATERPLTRYELAYFQLLFNNLVRFIGDDFTPVAPYRAKEYPTSYCVSQGVYGKFTMRIYLDMGEKTAVEFACRYAREIFPEFDEYVQAALEDFLNLHNGLFTVNLSNDYSVELQLTPPGVETPELLTFTSETYLLPIVYPFGTFHFIIEMSAEE